MKYLITQTEFEELLGKQPLSSYDVLPNLTIILFTAMWCGPCKRINLDLLESKFPANWLKCDIDQNDYTAGYCGIRSIPTFMVIYKTKIVDTKSSSNTEEIIAWLDRHV